MAPHKIISVEENSVSAALGIVPGDILLAVNGEPVADVFDYRMLTREKSVALTIQGQDGRRRLLRAKKPQDTGLGLVFESGLMDASRSCANKCVFCFIDQLPPGMRPTLYHKDDDMRLSFLSGNYVTLTNMPEREINRLISHRLSPVNISVHATDPALRAAMLNNPKAALIMEHIRKFAAAGIKMNFQIVLCKGVNDGEALERSVRALAGSIPAAQSLSVVPAGLTKYRAGQGLPYIAPHTPQDAREVVARVEKWQEEFLERYKTRFVYAGDEFYVRAGLPVPPCESYEDFPQIENGVGMTAEFEREVREALEDFCAGRAGAPGKGRPPERGLAGLDGNIINNPACVSVVTGLASAEFMKNLCSGITSVFPGLRLDVHPVRNEFFGENVTVSGLLTGKDIVGQLKSKPLGERLLIPGNALRRGEDVFLDDMTLEEARDALGVEAVRVPVEGKALVDKIASIYFERRGVGL